MARDSASGEPSNELRAGAELLRALAALVGLGIVRGLSGRHRRVHELVDALGASRPLLPSA